MNWKQFCKEAGKADGIDRLEKLRVAEPSTEGTQPERIKVRPCEHNVIRRIKDGLPYAFNAYVCGSCATVAVAGDKNAHLIAAAPTMYEALNLFLRKGLCHESIQAANLAVQEAEGRTAVKEGE